MPCWLNNKPLVTKFFCMWLFFSYPVILSIENHCSVPQQKKMAQYLIEILGDKLDLSNIKSDEAGRLPSPEMLKGKILVKVTFKSASFQVIDSLWWEKSVQRQFSQPDFNSKRLNIPVTECSLDFSFLFSLHIHFSTFSSVFVFFFVYW